MIVLKILAGVLALVVGSAARVVIFLSVGGVARVRIQARRIEKLDLVVMSLAPILVAVTEVIHHGTDGGDQVEQVGRRVDHQHEAVAALLDLARLGQRVEDTTEKRERCRLGRNVRERGDDRVRPDDLGPGSREGVRRHGDTT